MNNQRAAKKAAALAGFAAGLVGDPVLLCETCSGPLDRRAAETALRILVRQDTLALLADLEKKMQKNARLILKDELTKLGLLGLGCRNCKDDTERMIQAALQHAAFNESPDTLSKSQLLALRTLVETAARVPFSTQTLAMTMTT